MSIICDVILSNKHELVMLANKDSANFHFVGVYIKYPVQNLKGKHLQTVSQLVTQQFLILFLNITEKTEIFCSHNMWYM